MSPPDSNFLEKKEEFNNWSKFCTEQLKLIIKDIEQTVHSKKCESQELSAELKNIDNETSKVSKSIEDNRQKALDYRAYNEKELKSKAIEIENKIIEEGELNERKDVTVKEGKSLILAVEKIRSKIEEVEKVINEKKFKNEEDNAKARQLLTETMQTMALKKNQINGLLEESIKCSEDLCKKQKEELKNYKHELKELRKLKI